jgi:predicted PurR-regulated permease PerM
VNPQAPLYVVAGVAIVWLLDWGAPFFVPLLVAILIAYALSPITDVVTRVVRWRVLAATIVIGSLLAAAVGSAIAWQDDMLRLWDRVPEAARAIAGSLKKVAQKPASPMAQVKKAAAEIESLAQTGKSAPPSPPVPASSTTPSSMGFWQMVWNGSRQAMAAASQLMVVIFLVFFMLASGNLFKRKLVNIFGETLSEKKITVQMIDEIDDQIRKYLLVVLVSNLLVGFGTWILFRLMGVEYPELWGMVAAILHTAPYFGPAIVALASLFAAFLQFREWGQAFLVAGASIVVATLVGSVFATWFASRQTQMNTTATFVGLLFFGWIWGLWGILLGIPILAIIRVVCERKEEWKPVSELLSR